MSEQSDQDTEGSAAGMDLVVYVGAVTRNGYRALSKQLEATQNGETESAYLMLMTGGGDPDAGYRIARALGHHYPEAITVLVPDFCKSAGTLIAIGGKDLVIGDCGELGPLDIQFSNKDEAFESSSGLDMMQAMSMLQQTVFDGFRQYLIDIRRETGIGTKLASEISSTMSAGLTQPILAQIDPMRLGEHQRSMNIATAYGERLNEKFENTTRENIVKLLAAYPSHSFVIDRKEATTLFKRVRAPNDLEISLTKLWPHVIETYGESSREFSCAVVSLATLAKEANATEGETNGDHGEEDGAKEEENRASGQAGNEGTESTEHSTTELRAERQGDVGREVHTDAANTGTD